VIFDFMSYLYNPRAMLFKLIFCLGYAASCGAILMPIFLLPYYVYLKDNNFSKIIDIPIIFFGVFFVAGLIFMILGYLFKINKYFSLIRSRAIPASIIMYFSSLLGLGFIFIFGTIYLFLPIDTLAMAMLRMLFVLAVINWCVLFVYKKRKLFLKNTRYQNQMFKVSDDAILIYRKIKVNIDYKINKKSWLSKNLNTFMPYVLILVPMGYPLQKSLNMAGGVEAMLLFLFILGAPCVIYFVAQLSWDFYLYVYWVWKLERQHGKPAYFAADE